MLLNDLIPFKVHIFSLNLFTIQNLAHILNQFQLKSHRFGIWTGVDARYLVSEVGFVARGKIDVIGGW